MFSARHMTRDAGPIDHDHAVARETAKAADASEAEASAPTEPRPIPYGFETVYQRNNFGRLD